MALSPIDIGNIPQLALLLFHRFESQNGLFIVTLQHLAQLRVIAHEFLV